MSIVIEIISVCIGITIYSGLIIGVEFVSLRPIIDLINTELDSAAQMSEKFGLSLSVFDIGSYDIGF